MNSTKSLNQWYLCEMLKTAQKNIRHLTLGELEQYFESVGEKKFRAKQAYEWIWQKGALSFADMTNLSKQLRQQLGESFTLPALTIDTTQDIRYAGLLPRPTVYLEKP